MIAIYRFMDASQAPTIFTVVAMSRVFQVCRESFYAWRRRVARRRQKEQEDRMLLKRIRTAHAASHRTYGPDRILACLLELGVNVSRRRVVRLMHAQGLRVRRGKRWISTVSEGRPHGIVDRVERRFRRDGPRQLLVSDATTIGTRNGKAHLAVTLDAWSRKVLGWAVSTTQNAELMTRTLAYALSHGRRSGMIHHSDQGHAVCVAGVPGVLRSPRRSSVDGIGGRLL